MDEREEMIAAAPGRPLQRREPRADGWTMARRRMFLEELAASCNVSRALAAAGMKVGSVYRLRQRDAQFAEQWRAALELGYERLEMALLRRAIEAVEGLMPDPDEEAKQPVEKMTAAEAMALLRQHRASVEGGRARGHRARPRHVVTQQEVDAILIKRMRMVMHRRQLRGGSGPAAGLPPPAPPQDGA